MTKKFSTLTALILCIPAAASQPGPETLFAEQVGPLLQERCLPCHNAETSKGGLRLHTLEYLQKGGSSGEPVLILGDTAASMLLQRVTSTDPDERMPPKGAPLSEKQVEALRSWIAGGAPWDQAVMEQPVTPGASHWAFHAPKQSPLPEVTQQDWPRTPIDSFLLVRMETTGLKPSAEADRATLIRRLSLDLIGLPPTPEEVEAYTSDTRPDAYEQLVERLLDSPHYGERQAVRWLDIAHYADTNGYEKDRPRPMWPYRDWVINAFNEDKPFDEFTVEQLAGDLMPHATQDQRIATGFLRNSLYNEEGGVDVEEFRFEAMVDRVNTTATAFLGLTLSCAQCHDHKYDPLSQRDYYSFFTFLNNTENASMPVRSPELDAARAAGEAEIAAAIAGLEGAFPPDEPVRKYHPLKADIGRATGDMNLSLHPEGVITAEGPRADKASYTLDLSLPAGTWNGLQLEALPADSLPQRGPGLADNGNFCITGVELSVRTPGAARQPMKLSRATADFEQEGYAAAGLLDTNPTTGWAVGDPQGGMGKQRNAQLWFEAPLTVSEGANLRLTLRQELGNAHLLGAFRLSAFQETLPDTSEPVEARRARNLENKFAAWLEQNTPRCKDWSVMEPVAYASAKTATLRKLDDRSILVTGECPNTDTYTVSLRSELPRITAIRLEALPHESLPGGGPGRGMIMSPDGDFFLSEVRAFAAPWNAPDQKTPLALTAPSADFAAAGREVALSLDGQVDTGWGINGGQGKAHTATFTLAEPLEGFEGGTLLTLELEHFYVHQHTLGRFRVSATNDDGETVATGLPASIEALLLQPRDTWSDSQAREVKAHYLSVAPELAHEHKRIDAMRAALPKYPEQLVLMERDLPRATHLHHRGQYLNPREEVSPATPPALHPFPASWPRNRMSFARWLVLPENPLFARVTVNRVWQTLMGRGLVETTEDFGLMASPPTHPELLDWLAVEFQRRGYSMKELLRLIVTSSFYRQQSTETPELLERDPRNELLARAPRFRLDAEVVRDTVLTSSGLLSRKMGGPGVYPPLSPELLQMLYTEGRNVWPTSEDEDRYRRGVYTFVKRILPYPSGTTFDMPNRDAVCTRRTESNTPLQALTLLNNSEFFVAAKAMGARAVQIAGDDTAKLEQVFSWALARKPDSVERETMLQFLKEQRERFGSGGLDPAPLTLEFPVAGVSPSEQAAWVALCRVVLNLDETISKT